MDISVKNIDDLRSEIARLRVAEHEQVTALSERFKSPSAIFSTAVSLFKSPVTSGNSKNNGFLHQDIVGLISRFVLPFTLNKTIFKNSGFIIKSIVGLVSQKASHLITEDSVASVWDKAKALF